MRNTTMVLVLCGVLLAAGGLARAHEGHEENGVQTLQGEVIDVACYLGHGASGMKHADCGQKCVLGGLPVAIKSGDTLYFAVSKDHQAMNKELGPWVGHRVAVTGEVSERDEEHLIAISNVKPLD